MNLFILDMKFLFVSELNYKVKKNVEGLIGVFLILEFYKGGSFKSK